ncbi:MAG: ISL3 family transposase [Allosphingosinicella sp.]|uniref:ISL3 family transposase n=1 Tax=Allosphingosinicella sp. TaxID=2823234 RepID=UPI003959D37A
MIKSEIVDEALHVSASYDVQPDSCPACGVVGQLYRHAKQRQPFRDAPAFGRQVVIFVTRQRWRCRECGTTFSQPLPDMDERRKMTIRCREYIAAQALLKPNTHVAEDVGVHEKVVRQIGAENAEKLVTKHEAGLKAPRILGIDELGLGGQMRAIFVNIEDSWPIELLTTRWEKPVLNFLLNLRDRDKVEVVTTDMWKPYRKAVRYAMPQAVLIVDKWHVQRMANDVMEVARRVYQGGAGISKETRKQLKKGRSIFLKRPYVLSERQLLDLDGWLKNTPELRGAYETKEAFMKIWDNRTADEAKAALDAWKASIPVHLQRLFRPVVTATRNWEDEILNYFRTGRQWTNAATEGRNRVIKMTNRLGAGYAFENIRARALFGKRPGRVKKEREAARLIALRTCASCKALFDPLPNAPHIKAAPKRKRFRQPVPDPLVLCSDCHELFNTDDVVTHGSLSTAKSE